jgi:3-oxo-5-alpha-steroid 4-dehydrogenase 3
MLAAHGLDLVANLNPATTCQLFYVLSAAAVLAIAAAPDSGRRLLTQYGARSSGSALASVISQDNRDTGRGFDNDNNGVFVRFIAWLTSVGKVPHSWFAHFYILSLSCTLFWAVQFVTHGAVLEVIVRNQSSNSTTSMTIGQVILVWFLMSLQGARRLYEYLAVLRPSNSGMWILHWLLGNTFYLFTSVSIWVEGSSELLCIHEISYLVLTKI